MPNCFIGNINNVNKSASLSRVWKYLLATAAEAAAAISNRHSSYKAAAVLISSSIHLIIDRLAVMME
jgi:hypothetical protein